MQRILDVLSEHAAHFGDDNDLGWQMTINGYVIRVEAGTRAEYATKEEACTAALALREALVAAVGESPLTHEEMRVVARPEGPHGDQTQLTGYRAGSL